MNKLSRTLLGTALVAAMASAPAQASTTVFAIAGVIATASEQPAQGASEPDAADTTRVKRIGTRLETVIVSAGAVDTDGRRWEDSGSAIGTLPTVSDSAFLDGDAESPKP